MNMLRKFFVAPVAAVVLTMAAACGGGNARTDAADGDSIAVEGAEEAEAMVIENAVVEVVAGDSVITPADKPIVVDFSATWCPPCQQFKPIFHEVAAAQAGNFLFYSVDCDSCPALANLYEVHSIPQVVVIYPDGHVYKAESGYMDKAQFETLLNSAK